MVINVFKRNIKKESIHLLTDKVMDTRISAHSGYTSVELAERTPLKENANLFYWLQI